MKQDNKIKIAQIAAVIEKAAPIIYAESWDNPGLLVGDSETFVSKVLLSLDFNENVLDEAIEKGAGLVISHHPFIFSPLKKITPSDNISRLVLKAIKNNVAIYAAHTNLDNAFGGLNYIVADKLHLSNVSVLEATEAKLYKLVTYIPDSHLDNVKDALFDVGVGSIGNYDRCSNTINSVGSFRAGAGTHPFVGEVGKVHCENEIRLEVILPAHLKSVAVKTLLAAHPYEEPVFDLFVLDNKYQRAGSGTIGELKEPLSEGDFLQLVKNEMNIPVLRHSCLCNKKIHKVAICTGAGAFLLNKAVALGADAFVTADVRYHEFFAPDNKLLLIDAGHYETEQFARQWFYSLIKKNFADFDVQISETSLNPVNYCL